MLTAVCVLGTLEHSYWYSFYVNYQVKLHTRSSVGHEAEARAALPAQPGRVAPPVEVTEKLQKRYVALKAGGFAVRLLTTPGPIMANNVVLKSRSVRSLIYCMSLQHEVRESHTRYETNII